MSLTEVAWRAHDALRPRIWAARQGGIGTSPWAPRTVPAPDFVAVLPATAHEAIPAEVRDGLITSAAPLLEGRWEFLGVLRDDLAAPDWHFDPSTGRSAPKAKRSFRIDHRSQSETGNIKQLWELSRLQHLTLLAAAWFATGDEAYATVVSDQLQSWWRANPFLYGVNWTSGIEIGIRLISWVWIRRLLDRWPHAGVLFEHNDVAVNQVFWHQRYLAALRSRGSSANNHVIAETAGQLVASCAFPWFAQSRRWREESAATFERELDRNTFASGVNREQATDYQAFVAELGLLAAVEADFSGHPLQPETWALLCRTVDASAAMLDEGRRAPRQGDGDDGRGVLLDPPEVNRWMSLLATGASLFGPAPWWPETSPTMMSILLGSMTHRAAIPDRPLRRPSHFRDAGFALLRTQPGVEREIWCRCDAGPHGYLSIAAHAHSDALSVEIRHAGVDVLADPGTYCYHGQPEWRRYFRSTLGHNTVEIAGRDQSLSGGPFLWLRHAEPSRLDLELDEDRGIQRWSAEHDGYQTLQPPARHHRTVQLDGPRGRIDIWDRIDTRGHHSVRMSFHLGPSVSADLAEDVALLRWPIGTKAGYASARFELPRSLQWTMHRGECQPILGWYSSHFGVKEPTTTLLGSGHCNGAALELHSSLQLSRLERI